jgi:hypothetical protein
VAAGGNRLLSLASPDPRLILVDWDFPNESLVCWSAEDLEPMGRP